MSFTETDSLVRALLHTLWQGGLAFLVLSAALALIPVRRASLRYSLCLLALASVLIAGIATWAWIDVSKPHPASTVPSVTATAVSSPGLSPNTDFPQANEMRPAVAPTLARPSMPQLSLSPSWVPWFAAFWGLGVVVSLIRCAGAVIGVGKLRRSSREADDPRLIELARGLCLTLGIKRPVRLLVSERISLPAVIGVLRPAVLIPASLLTGLSPEYLRAVLAHEFAHIARWDYLVNLGQMLIEALLFFNPFVWWISRQIRLEREACCDLAASVDCADPHLYVKAILACTETFSNKRRTSLGCACLGTSRQFFHRPSSAAPYPRPWRLRPHPVDHAGGSDCRHGADSFRHGKGSFLGRAYPDPQGTH
ncbi:MAG: M56 family metallopeptidase [Chthoniobacteraceae bacterium]